MKELRCNSKCPAFQWVKEHGVPPEGWCCASGVLVRQDEWSRAGDCSCSTAKLKTYIRRQCAPLEREIERRQA